MSCRLDIRRATGSLHAFLDHARGMFLLALSRIVQAAAGPCKTQRGRARKPIAEHIALVLPDRITRVPDAERSLVQALQGAHVDRREVFVRGRADAALTWVSVSVHPSA